MKRVSLAEVQDASSAPDADVVEIDDALSALAKFDPRKAKVVELKFFGGLDWDETAEVLNVSKHTVMRDWKVAKVWLVAELKGSGVHGS